MKQNTEKVTTVEDVELVEVDAIAPGPVAPAGGTGVVGGVSGAAVGADRYLDVVKDVEIKLLASLGTAELTVGELFNMKHGGVIKLDKDSAEPIELTLNGQLVARGTLVVVDDNFGIQLTEVTRL